MTHNHWSGTFEGNRREIHCDDATSALRSIDKGYIELRDRLATP